MLESKRLYLRLMEEEDIGCKVSWVNNPNINQTLNFDLPVSKIGTKQWLNNVSRDNSRKDFIICSLENDVPIGFAGVLNIDKTHSKAESYITIGDEQFRGQKLSKEVKLLLLEYAFHHLGLNKVYLYVWNQNEQMINLAKSVGFEKEGQLRQDLFSHGEFRDRIVMGILKEDFQTFGRTELKKIK